MNSKTYFLHIANGYTRRGTIAATIKGNQLNIGLALCSVGDNFNKSIGRLIAGGRAEKNPLYTVELAPEELVDLKFGRIVHNVLKETLREEMVKNKITSIKSKWAK